MAVKALRLRVVGIVQGVGFRPFIYRLAVSEGLSGYVRNLGGSEVEIVIEGSEASVSSFLNRLEREKPPPARIEELHVEEIEPRGFTSFRIERSSKSQSRRSMIPPDFGICDDCVREILDPKSRFYRYYWNSCAWCGPRFSMMYGVPYDRENTSMRDFPLCNACRRDYSDPGNIRRFHAQGISCPRCGPKTFVYDAKGRLLRVDDPVEWAAERLEEGSIIALKGVGGFHIAAIASRDDVVEELRRRKRRPSKPFALMARDCGVVEEITEPPPGACSLLRSPERPILLLPKRAGSRVSELVAPGLDTLGVMLPYTGFQVLLLRRVRDGFLIMTSGNKSGSPMCTTLKCVLEELSDVVDYIVAHERRIVHRVDDSVLRYTDGEPVFLRRSRGYAPAWLRVRAALPEAAAVGAELQVVGAVSFEDKIVPTQYIGDLDDPGNLGDLERELRWFISVYRLKPAFIAMDMHPAYHSRETALRLASDYGAELVEVQHHHAHAASAMAEHGYPPGSRAVAITIDGTGYGVDGGVWGGEILLASYEDFERIGHLHPFPLPGGERAVIWSVRGLIGLLESSGYTEEETLDILRRRGLLDKLPYGEREARIAYRQAEKGLAPVTTSMGRTLDAISALLGVAWRRTYEGEQAMKLEAAARGGRDMGYTPPLNMVDGRLIVDTPSLISWLIESIEEGIPIRDLAITALRGLGRALGEAAAKAASTAGRAILLSGGASVNTYIVQGVREAANAQGLRVELQRRLPPGDGGVAVGQIMVGAAKMGLLEAL